MKVLNWHQSGLSFLANLRESSMSFSVSSGKPNMKEHAVLIPFFLQSLNAVSTSWGVVFLPMRCRIFCDADSTPNQIVLHPALLINDRSSSLTRSTRVSQTHSKSSLFSSIKLQSSVVSFFRSVKLSLIK